MSEDAVLSFGDKEKRPVWQSVKRGFMCRCPKCGTGSLFTSYLKVTDTCATCGEELRHHRADDAPPYLTITLVGHIIIPAMLFVEKVYQPDLWVHSLLWLPLTLVLALAFLPLIKGGVVGLQWANRMHGFDKSHLETESDIAPAPSSA